jgi:hypothetical protein
VSVTPTEARLIRWTLGLALAVQALGTLVMCVIHWSDFAALVLVAEVLYVALCALALHATAHRT